MSNRAGYKRSLEELAVSLRNRLSADLAAGEVRRLQRGRIHRDYYAAEFGLVRFPGRIIHEVIEPFERDHPPGEVTEKYLAKMRRWLEDRFRDRTLEVRKTSRKVLRKPFALAFGLVYERFEESLPGVATLLSEFDRKVLEEGYEPDRVALALARRTQPPVLERRERRPGNNHKGLRERLAAVLEADFIADRVVVGAGHKIVRKHYGELLGVTSSAVSYHCDVLDYYEGLLGGRRSVNEDRITEMEEWLLVQMAAGTLEVSNRKVSRKQLKDAFGLPYINKLRTPLIHLLLERFDQKVVAENYVPQQTRSRLTKLRKALANPPLQKSGIKVSRRALTKLTGLEEHALKTGPYRTSIDEIDDLIAAEISASTVNFELEGYSYVFAPLLEWGWPKLFVEGVREAFKDALPNLPSKRRQELYRETKEFFFSLAGDVAILFATQESGSIRDQRAWSAVRAKYRSKVRKERGVGRANAALSLVNKLQDILVETSLVPEADFRLPHFPREESGNLRTLAEAPPIGKPANPVRSHPDRYIEFVQTFMEAARPNWRDQIESSEQYDFVDTIRTQIERWEGPLPGDPREAVATLLESRINAANVVSQREICMWRDHYMYGQALLQAAADTPRIINKLSDINERGRRSKHFHLITAASGKERGLGNLLLFVSEFHASLLPGGAMRFLREVYSEYGRFDEVQAYLIPHRDAIAAAIMCYYCLGGSNAVVGRLLPRNFTSGVRRGLLDIEGVKDKSDGSDIHVETPEDSFVATALEWIRTASDGFRDRAKPSDRAFLFLVATRGQIKVIGEGQLREAVKRMAGKSETLRGLNIVPSMLRTSKLLLGALRNDGKIRVGSAFGQHSETVSAKNYQFKDPTRLIHDTTCRSFQNDMETVTIEEDPALIALLGMTKEDFAKRTPRLRRTGMGTLCRQEGGSCQSLECWDCPDILVVAEVKLIALMQCWKISLSAARPRWEVERPERWQNVWLRWLRLIEDVERKMTRGGMIVAWDNATQFRQNVERQPGFRLPQPW